MITAIASIVNTLVYVAYFFVGVTELMVLSS